MSRVVIPVFAHQLYAKCPKCEGSISIPPGHNPLMSLGYQCSGCLSRYIIVQCPNCKALDLLNSVEWNSLRQAQAFQCKECGFVAVLKTRSAKLRLSPLRMAHTLRAWLGGLSEQAFLELVANTFPVQKSELVARIHGTIGYRIQSTKDTLNKLREHGVKAVEMHNSKNFHLPSGNQSIYAEDAVFRMSNALISALEMLTQEVVASLEIDWAEDRVSFNDAIKKSKFLPHSPALHSTFRALQNSPEFQYLTKLRNCIHHRWNMPWVVESDFIVEDLGPIEEAILPSRHTVLLPDDPSLPANKITFNERRGTFETLVQKIEHFADGVYQALCHDVRRLGMQK